MKDIKYQDLSNSPTVSVSHPQVKDMQGSVTQLLGDRLTHSKKEQLMKELKKASETENKGKKRRKRIYIIDDGETYTYSLDIEDQSTDKTEREEKIKKAPPRDHVAEHATFGMRFLTLTFAFFLSGLWATVLLIMLNRGCDFENCSPLTIFIIMFVITVIFIGIVWLFDLDHVRNAF